MDIFNIYDGCGKKFRCEEPYRTDMNRLVLGDNYLFPPFVLKINISDKIIKKNAVSFKIDAYIGSANETASIFSECVIPGIPFKVQTQSDGTPIEKIFLIVNCADSWHLLEYNRCAPDEN